MKGSKEGLLVLMIQARYTIWPSKDVEDINLLSKIDPVTMRRTNLTYLLFSWGSSFCC